VGGQLLIHEFPRRIPEQLVLFGKHGMFHRSAPFSIIQGTQICADSRRKIKMKKRREGKTESNELFWLPVPSFHKISYLRSSA
jgi:hypothetical protein